MSRKLRETNNSQLKSIKGLNIPYLREYVFRPFVPRKENFSRYKAGASLGDYPCDTWDFLSGVFNLNRPHIADLQTKVKYKCPLTNNFYYGAYPVAYLAEKKPRLKKAENEFEEFLLAELSRPFTPQGILHENLITQTFMGHGYNELFKQYDSQPEKKFFMLKINNKEHLIFNIWTEI